MQRKDEWHAIINLIFFYKNQGEQSRRNVEVKKQYHNMPDKHIYLSINTLYPNLQVVTFLLRLIFHGKAK